MLELRAYQSPNAGGDVEYKRFAAKDVIIHEIPQRFVGSPNQQLDLSGVSEGLTGPRRCSKRSAARDGVRKRA